MADAINAPEVLAKQGATPWLHIRSQFTYHFEAEIRGTKAGLIALRSAVTAAIESQAGESDVFSSDGEGYRVNVHRVSTVANLGSPTYIDQEARELAYHERDFLIRQSKANRKFVREAEKALRWCRANGNPHNTTVPS